MSDPLTKDDLYGTSTTDVKPSSPPLSYEETPVIEPVPESVPAAPAPPSPSPQSLPPVGYLPKSKQNTGAGGFGKFIIFIVLFGVGIWLSSYVRQYLPKSIDVPFLPPTKTVIKSTPTLTADKVSPTDTVVSTAWKSYQVISGTTKKPIEGVSIMLPPGVLSLICDGVNCASQGTYLSGGTRFTVAARGTGQILPDFRGTVISDVGGITFTTKPILVAGQQSMEFTGIFTGRTISGYAFSKMRGVMIPVTSTLSLEVNHFTPSGITADFDADDKVFDEILQKLTLSAAGSQEKGATITATLKQ